MGIRIDDSEVRALFKELNKMPAVAMKKVLPKTKQHTPIASGNARAKTRLKNKTTIRAGYPYADRLDNGWSQQAPNGFTDPSIDDLDKIIEQQVRDING